MPLLTDGSYVTKAKSFDKAGNVSSAYSDSFSYDSTVPTVTLVDIPNFVDTLISIRGTAGDVLPGHVNRVEVTVCNSSDSTYWNGSSWAPDAIWLHADGVADWSYAMPSLSNGNYIVHVKSIDNAGNESAIALESFTCDTTAPTVVMTNIPDATNSVPSIEGTAFDTPPGELDKVQLILRDTSYAPHRYWSGSSWTPAIVWLDITAGSGWSYTLPNLTDGHHYTAEAKSVDKAGNESDIATDSFKIDTSLPTVSVNSIPSIINTLDSVSGTAADEPPGTVERVQVTINNTTNSTYWDGYSWAPSEIWLNAIGTTGWVCPMPILIDADYLVRAKSIDDTGNTSATVSISFTFDSTGPEVTVPDVAVNNSTLTFTGSATDTTSSIASVEYRVDGSSWQNASFLPYAGDPKTGSYAFTMVSPTSASPQVTVEVRATDALGNITFQAKYATRWLQVLVKGWNLVPYTGPTKDILAALGNIADDVNSMWGFDSLTQKWLFYCAGVPSWVNSLQHLEHNGSYWINVEKNSLWIC